MKQLHIKAAERQKLTDEIKGLFAKGDENLTADDMTAIETKSAAIAVLDTEIERLKGIEEIATQNAARDLVLSGVDNAGRPNVTGDGTVVAAGTKSIEIPTRFKGSVPKFFRSISDTRGEAQVKAYRMGMWLLATLGGSQKCAKWCNEHGLTIIKAQSENVNEAGGFLVPEELDADLIQLREQFGVARQLFKKVTMGSDTKRRPRRKGGLRAYHLADGDGITASTKGWDSVSLTAEKIAILAYYSNELSEDAIIDIADDLAYEIAWAFALQEDEDGFLGDGTDTYGGFMGVCPVLQKVWTTSGGAGLKVGAAGTGADWTKFTLTDFNRVKGALPRFAALAQPCWVTTEEFWATVMEALLVAAGGNRVQDVENGSDGMKFLGKPVVIAQVLPIVPAVNSIPCLYGAFRLGADFGDRRETTIARSSDFAFGTDQLAIRGTERYAINVHDVGGPGNAANPAQPGPQAGPIVGLQCAST